MNDFSSIALIVVACVGTVGGIVGAVLAVLATIQDRETKKRLSKAEETIASLSLNCERLGSQLNDINGIGRVTIGRGGTLSQRVWSLEEWAKGISFEKSPL